MQMSCKFQSYTPANWKLELGFKKIDNDRQRHTLTQVEKRRRVPMEVEPKSTLELI